MSGRDITYEIRAADDDLSSLPARASGGGETGRFVGASSPFGEALARPRAISRS
jgi:hypothetical protein